MAGLGTPYKIKELVKIGYLLSISRYRWRIGANSFVIPIVQPVNWLPICSWQKVTINIIDDSLRETGVTFSQGIREKIYTYTLGHPYELQVLCSNLYESQLQGRVDETEWDQAFKNALWELGRDYFEVLYRKASSREETVLLALAEAKTDLSISETTERVGAENSSFPLRNVKHFLYRLSNKGLIKRTDRKSFEIPDPMLREYILQKSLIR